jgi:hypothetical protein
MNRMPRMLATAAMALGVSALAGAACAADAVGTVTVTGSVASKCTVITGGTAGGLTFASAFGTAADELADSVGHLNTGWGAQPFSTATNGGNFQISCNKANPSLKIAATPMQTAGTAPTGYANTVSYQAYADFKAIDTSNSTSTVTLQVNSGTTAGGANSTGNLGGLYLQNTTNNVVVRADTFATAGGAGNILLTGTYTGTITVTITPS